MSVNSTQLEKWSEMSKRLKALKEEEMELRKELCGSLIDISKMKNGRLTEKGKIDHLKYKVVQALSYRIDQSVLTALLPALSEYEKSCIRWKPELALTNYKKLPANSILHEAVISGLSAPVLTVEDDNYGS